MGWRIVKQPNGLFARFSEIVDDFTDFDMNEEGVIELCKTEYHMDNKGSQGKLQRAIDNPQRWDEAIKTIEAIHDIDVANERRKMILGETSKNNENDAISMFKDALNNREDNK